MHVVEIQTVHRDGSETWQRWRCADAAAAEREAVVTRVAFFEDQYESVTALACRQLLPTQDWLINDLGEPICVRAREYGAASQVRLGVFTILN
jgi:hypothetical protein